MESIFRTLCISALLAASPPIFEAAQAEERSVTIIEGVTEGGQPKQPSDDDSLQVVSNLRTENTAGLRLVMHPGTVLPLGTTVTFDVTTEKPGYLVLVDINAANQMTQIYPNLNSLVRSNDKAFVTNLMQPGTVLTVPNLKNPLARFTFKADLPVGHGAIVAILSEQAVQIIDLPELPVSVTGLQASVDFLQKSIRNLLVAEANKTGHFSPNNWSMTASEYCIR
jgi:hypothetical protein